MRWFTSDTHFYHKAIIEHCYRPFKTIDEMNNTLIFNWNKYIIPSDDVFILGDFVWGSVDDFRKVRSICDKLTGQKHLILGNHDNLKPFTYLEAGIISVHTSLEVNGYILVHDPAPAGVFPNKKWLCGHVHNLFTRLGSVQNVGVDVNDFYPIAESQLFADVF